MNSPNLAALIGYARAGAVEFAWERFRTGSYSASDPQVMTIKARLLKDLALRASPGQRMPMRLAAAEAYEEAGALRPASYPLINAATLYFLAGDTAKAADLARRTLRLIESDADEPETPYYRAATQAEAFLLLNAEPEARTALVEAIALAPRAWEDHASTLRQFALILDTQGGDSSWLDILRPPRSLHFGGHMSFDPKVVRREHLDEKIAAVLDEENVGFGYGALAAGADIIIAEALLARGAELHAVLPGGVEALAAVSV
jgi:tetratricopeptide (TPR) repeat protein